MANSNEIKQSAEAKLLEAIYDYAATAMGIDRNILKEFGLKEGYPRINFEQGIYDQTVNIEVEVSRVAR